MKDPLKFDKKVYWDRRRKGLHGQIHEYGSKEQRYDERHMMKKMRADTMKKIIQKETNNESKEI